MLQEQERCTLGEALCVPWGKIIRPDQVVDGDAEAYCGSGFKLPFRLNNCEHISARDG